MCRAFACMTLRCKRRDGELLWRIEGQGSCSCCGGGDGDGGPSYSQGNVLRGKWRPKRLFLLLMGSRQRRRGVWEEEEVVLPRWSRRMLSHWCRTAVRTREQA